MLLNMTSCNDFIIENKRIKDQFSCFYYLTRTFIGSAINIQKEKERVKL